MVDTVRGADFQARGLLLALRAGEPVRVGRALALEGVHLGEPGRAGQTRARAMAQRVRRLAASEGDP